MADRSYCGLLWVLALGAIVADQGTKYDVFARLHNDGYGGSAPLIPGAFELLAQFTDQPAPAGPLAPLRTWGGASMPRVNHGALFGWKLFGLAEDVAANRVFLVISMIAAGAIMFWSTCRSMNRDWLLCTALGLILGGTIGNLYDRIVFNGVRDFLHWHYGFEWPVFNIADCCLVVGACLLLAQALFTKPVAEPAEPATAEVAQTQ